jgi:hypothetical protein
MIFADKPLIVRVFLRPPEGDVSTLLLSLLKEMGGMVLMLGVLLSLASRSLVRNLAIVDALIVGLLHSGGDTASFTLDDRHWQYVSGVPLVGAICRAAGNSRFALLAEAAGGPLGTCREFLKSELLAAGQDVVPPDTVALRPDLRQRKR